ncbi:MAG: alginate O-acetyltransferase AlgX-related protein [Planctomycetota bacterium]|jgi:hypothetical protein
MPTNEHDVRRPSWSSWIVTLAFGLGITSPLVRFVLSGPDLESARLENRAPTPRPVLELEPERLASLPERTEVWFADGFPGRRDLIRAHNALLWFGLGISSSPEMLLGSDEWLYFRGGDAFDVYRGVEFEEGELDAWVDRYADWEAWLRARDADYVVLIAPEKQDVYPEHLPRWIGERRERTRTDAFVEGLRSAGLTVVDTRGVLRAAAAADEELLYYPLGTHWNHVGAYLAYQELARTLESRAVWWRPVPRVAFDLFTEDDPLGQVDADDFTSRMFLDDLVDQPLRTLVQKAPLPWSPIEVWPNRAGGIDGVTVVDDERLPRLVFLRDSFGSWLWRYLANHASRMSTQTDVRFDVELVERERPDLVLTERVERLLVRPITELDLDPRELDAARAWNAGEPLAVTAGSEAGGGLEPSLALDGISDGDGRSTAVEPGILWLRFEREVTTERSVPIPPARWAGRFTDSRGETTEFEVVWPAGRRWAFVELETEASVGRISVGEPGGAGGLSVLDPERVDARRVRSRAGR